MNEETYELKLYSPITGHLMEDDQDDFDAAYYDYEGTPLSPYEMAAFETVVKKAIEDETMPEEVDRGLMEYYIRIARILKLTGISNSIPTNRNMAGGRCSPCCISICETKASITFASPSPIKMPFPNGLKKHGSYPSTTPGWLSL